MSKIIWKYGENDSQCYYDAYVCKDYLCVFANKWQPTIWMGMYEVKGNSIVTICDKTRNDYQRKRDGLPLGCDISKLNRITVLCNKSPEYMMKKVEHCYKHRKKEVCQ